MTGSTMFSLREFLLVAALGMAAAGPVPAQQPDAPPGRAVSEQARGDHGRPDPDRAAADRPAGAEQSGGGDGSRTEGRGDEAPAGGGASEPDSSAPSATRQGTAPSAQQEDAAPAAAMAGASAAGAAAAAPTATGERVAAMQGPSMRAPVVVELFTAQGCVSCPPADAMLAELAGRKDVLALGFHVDYWDYLGWRDEFARPEFTERQKAYARQIGQRSLFTPQVIVAGMRPLPQARPAELTAALHAERAEGDRVQVSSRSDGPQRRIELTPRRALPETIAVQLVRYLPERHARIDSGENAGRRLSYINVVVQLDTLAMWDGRAPLRLTVTLGEGEKGGLPADTRHALIIQHDDRGRPGEIFAAVRLD